LDLEFADACIALFGADELEGFAGLEGRAAVSIVVRWETMMMEVVGRGEMVLFLISCPRSRCSACLQAST
jgi:hypothetical protein